MIYTHLPNFDVKICPNKIRLISWTRVKHSMPQFVKQIKTHTYSKPSLYFDHSRCEEISQNELAIFSGKSAFLYYERKNIELVSFPSLSLLLGASYMILHSLKTWHFLRSYSICTIGRAWAGLTHTGKENLSAFQWAPRKSLRSHGPLVVHKWWMYSLPVMLTSS